jgi:hypothetical protein
MSDYRVSIRGGEVFVSWQNPEIRAREEKRKTDQVLSDVLQFPIEIKDTTFGQFFELIAREADLYERVFKAAMYGHPLAPYIEEARRPDGNPEQIQRMEVYWSAERSEGDVSIGIGFHGYGKLKIDASDEMPVETGIAIEFTPLNQYKMLPFALDTKFEIYDADNDGRMIINGWREFTAYDVIKAILCEITWAGDISKGRPTVDEFTKGKEGQ